MRSDLRTALADANATMDRVLTRLDQLGVRSSDVQTTGLQMNAVYDYHSYGPPTLRGYRVSQRAEVLVRDLTRGGQAVTAAVETGGDDVRVGNIGLRIADTDSLLAQSRQAAVKQATAKAQEYADATGQDLGDVISLREVRASAPRVQPLSYSRDALMSAKSAADPGRQGQARGHRQDRVVVPMRSRLLAGSLLTAVARERQRLRFVVCRATTDAAGRRGRRAGQAGSAARSLQTDSARRRLRGRREHR